MCSHHESWKKFLNSNELKTNLINISIYIATFEILKNQLTDKPKIFYSEGFDADGLILGEKYHKNITNKSKRIDLASLNWLKSNNAINDDDIEDYHCIRRHRNELTHEMINYVSSSTKQFNGALFEKMVDIINKIEKWWFAWFEVEINPDLLPTGASPEEVTPGTLITIQLLLDIALGREPNENFYYDLYINSL